MKVYKFFPEGWREERLTEENEIKQGIVEKCDSNYNLYVKLENGKEGIIPRKEIEAINVEKDGKIGLSIKKAKDKPARQVSSRERMESFESKMNRFLKDSEDRLASLKKHTESRRGGRGAKRG